MKKFLSFVLLSGLMSGTAFAAMGGAGAASEWGDTDILRKISIQQGTSVSAWEDRGNIVTFATMTAVGDGTYYIEVSTNYNMVPGATYNYMFFAQTPSTWAPTGLTANTVYPEPIPDSGVDAAFVVCTDSKNVSGTLQSGAAYYSSLGGDARRVLTIPSGITSLWVYNNFGSTPSVSVSAVPAGQSSIDLSWTPIGDWGSSAEAVDVTAGGNYALYRSSALDINYSLILSTSGTYKTYTDTGAVNGPLVAGDTYYYVIISSDAYAGATNTVNTPGGNLVDGRGSDVASSDPAAMTADISARPAAPIPVYFKVEKPNWDYIKQNGYVVYLTPAGEDGRVYTNKIQGKIVRVCIPRT